MGRCVAVMTPFLPSQARSTGQRGHKSFISAQKLHRRASSGANPPQLGGARSGKIPARLPAKAPLVECRQGLSHNLRHRLQLVGLSYLAEPIAGGLKVLGHRPQINRQAGAAVASSSGHGAALANTTNGWRSFLSRPLMIRQGPRRSPRLLRSLLVPQPWTIHPAQLPGGPPLNRQPPPPAQRPGLRSRRHRLRGGGR